MPAEARAGLALVGTAVLFAAEHQVKGLRLPQTERQIPSSVVAHRRPVNAWRFAVPYGTGLFTYLPSSSPHVLALWLVCTASSPMVVASAATFGAGRGLPLLVRSLTRHRDSYEGVLQAFTRRFRPVAPLLVTVLATALTLGA